MGAKKSKFTEKVPVFYNNLKLTEKKIWNSLNEGVTNRKSFFHTPVLGTLDLNNKVKIRTLVLREVNRRKLTLRFHTDIRSKKIKEIQNHSASALHIYDPIQKIQVQINGTSRLYRNKNYIDKIWEKMTVSSKACYRLIANPGDAIKYINDANYPSSCDPFEGKKNFSMLCFKIENIEWLYLSSSGHRRSFYDYSGRLVKSGWLAP